MNALQAVESCFEKLGYPPLVRRRDYRFADVWAEDSAERTVALAVFTQLPESFRSAAFGVIEGREEEAAEAIAARRALGAPLFLSIEGNRVTVWRVGASGAPQRLGEPVRLEALDELFERHRDLWNPHALHRAKALSQPSPRQLDLFFDLGLLPAIDCELQRKLDALLREVLHQVLGNQRCKVAAHAEMAFRITFRLLAAKILRDCKYKVADAWNYDDARALLKNIATYYRLQDMQATQFFPSTKVLTQTWELLSNSLSLQNVSADTLAFVYENTLVTPENRKLLSIHSTPQPLADYVLRHLDLGRFNLDSLHIHEPFTGAGVFLVNALRHLQNLLPIEWTPQERHTFLVPRISGSELDPFACEVAALSLMLADYPNANGWESQIQRRDLFQESELSQALAGATIILCNPPFERFETGTRKSSKSGYYKAQFALHAALDAKPEALGFVMPHGLLHQPQYHELRKRLSSQFRFLNLLSLPEGMFQQSNYETALLIATEPKASGSNEASRLRLNIVASKDRKKFLDTGEASISRVAVRPADGGEFWIRPLEEDLSEYLSKMPRLGEVIEITRGLQWKLKKASVFIGAPPPPGFSLGVCRPGECLRPYKLIPQQSLAWLDFSSTSQRRPGPLGHPWERPKVLVNALRMRTIGERWQLVAASDTNGLGADQNFFGIWPKEGRISIETIAAIINNPLASLLLPRPSTQNLANEMLENLPLPVYLNEQELNRAVASYRAGLDALDAGLPIDEAELEARLRRIDELVLDGYGLPGHLRRKLFEYFDGETRPVPHRFSGWDMPAPGGADVSQAARERALARGRRLKAADLEKAGGGLTVQAVAQLLETTPAEVERLAEQGALLAVPADDGLLFPAIQFEGHTPVPGLGEWLAAFPGRNPWVRLNYLVNPDLRLGGRRPIDVLRGGEVGQAIAAARLVGEHLAA